MAKIIHLQKILGHTPGYPLSSSSDVFRFTPWYQPLSQTDVPMPLRTSLDLDTLEAILDHGDEYRGELPVQGFRSVTPSDLLTAVQVYYEIHHSPGHLNSLHSSPSRVKWS